MKRRHVNSWKIANPLNYKIVDCFAGGGGASTGIEMALGREPDVCVNHNSEALAMHEANHPWSVHLKTDVREISPEIVTDGKPVGLAWFSPDCTNFSKAKGGKPLRPSGKKSRGLAWVIVSWARKARPRVIILENVEEFQTWGPVIQKIGVDGFPVFDAKTGEPWYVPCPNRRGVTFQKWVRRLEVLGYQVEWKELKACDYGSPTIRKRLFIIARCDGEPIVWPEPTHGKSGSAEVLTGTRQPWRTAADIIDWSLPCPSIFLTRKEGRKIGVKRPLEESTLKRIHAGLMRYVIKCAKPFLVNINHQGGSFRGFSGDDLVPTVTCSREALGVIDPALVPFVSVGQHGGANRSISDPLHTVTASEKDQNTIVAPVMKPAIRQVGVFACDQCGYHFPGSGDFSPSPRQELDGYVLLNSDCPECGSEASLFTEHETIVAPILSREFGNSGCASVEQPVPTVMSGGNDKTAVVAPYCVPRYSERDGQSPRCAPADQPTATIVPTGNGASLVAPILDAYHGPKGDMVGRSAEIEESLRTLDTSNRRALVEAFLAQHNTDMIGHHPAKPLSTVTGRGTQQQVVEVTSAAIVGCGGRAAQSPPTGMDKPVSTVTGKADKCLAAAYLSHNYTSNTGGGQGNPEKPVKTVVAGGTHHAAVMAFLQMYYSEGTTSQNCDKPIHTIPSRDRFSLVTVNEQEYVIVDIGMRMLSARELFSAQGFPPNYKIDVWCDDRRNKDGKPMKPAFLTKEAQVHCAGNSVCPQVAAALVGANCPWLRVQPEQKPVKRNRVLGEFYTRKRKAVKT